MMNIWKVGKTSNLVTKITLGIATVYIVIFGLVALFVYHSAVDYILGAERNLIETNTSVIEERLSKIEETLTADSVTKILYENRDTNMTTSESGMAGAVKVFKKDITNSLYFNQEIFIYDIDRNLIFTSMDTITEDMRITPEGKLQKEVRDGVSFYILTQEVVGSDGQVLGYVQLTHELTYYSDLTSNITFVNFSSYAFAFILALICIVVITHFFLRPLANFKSVMVDIMKNPNALDRRTKIRTGDEIQELSEIFDGMMDRLEEHNELQTRFLSDVSHELRTPVAVIKGHLGLLRRWGKNDPEILDESLDAAYHESDRMTLMINDMLDTIRVQGDLKEHLEKTAYLPDSIETVISNFKILQPTANITSHVEAGLPMAKIYQVHFEQVMTILLDNALKYSNQVKDVDVSLKQDGAQLVLTVSDHGDGIDGKDLDHIFERFYRTDESRNRTSTKSGVGIGLSILSKITKAYGCKVTVSSQLGVGSTFVVTIPIAK